MGSPVPRDAQHRVKNSGEGRTGLWEHLIQLYKWINMTDSCDPHRNACSLTYAVGESKASNH